MLDKLSTSEKRRVKEAVQRVLEKYRDLKLGLPGDKSFCELIEQVVDQLPEKERFLIQQRFMSQEADYLTNQIICNQFFEPAISEVTFIKIRDRAMVKIALKLKIDCGFDLVSKLNI